MASSMAGDDDDDGVTVPPALAAAAAWSWRVLVILAAIAVTVIMLIQLYVVVVPVILALFLAAVLEPLVARLRAHRWPRALAAATVFLGLLAVLGLLFTWIGTSVAGEFGDLGDRLDEAVEDAKTWAQGDPLNLTRERVDQLETDIRKAVKGASAGAADQALTRARAAGEAIGGLVLFLFTLFFILKDGDRIAAWMRSRIPSSYRDDAVALAIRSRVVMRQYLIATALTGFIDAVLIAVALILLGIPLVGPLALLTFLGGFIPIVGATVAGMIAAVVALVTDGLLAALLVVAATIVVQQVEGNLLQPLILERAIRLHPLVTVWAVGAGLVVGGILGAFLAVPLVAIVVGVGSHFRSKSAEAEAEPSVEPAAESEAEPSEQ